MNGLGLLGEGDPSPAVSYAAHARALGAVPDADSSFIEVLARSGLRGRGGGAFPTAVKWAAVAERRARRPVVLVNGAEGEPASAKDQLLMTARPHLVIDGALVAARAVGAGQVIFYVGGAHAPALATMGSAIADRPDSERALLSLIAAPPGYVACEESAAVHFVNGGAAVPTSVPPRPYERGVNGRPTLVNNVETLAHAALIARFGDAWFRRGGTPSAPGTVLCTLGGAVQRRGVIEVAQGTTVGDAVHAGGGLRGECAAVLVGGYFGTWHGAAEAWAAPLDAVTLAHHGHTLGCGVIHVQPASMCAVATVSRVLAFLAHESAQQCGPCVFGLRSIAAALDGLAGHRGNPDSLLRVQRWAGLVRGRGACRHPDGASQFVRSALTVFAADFRAHAHGHRCLAPASPAAAS